MRIALLVPPGISRYGFAEKLSEKYKVKTIDLNEILLKEVNSGSEVGLDIKRQVDNSKPVSDDNINAVLTKTIIDAEYNTGFILENVPCNGAQATAIDNILKKQFKVFAGVVFLRLDYDLLMESMTGQMTCRNCKAQFNIYTNPPMVDMVCDECGGSLYKRTDDREETISRRIREFESYEEPLTKYLENRIRIIKGDIDPDRIYQEILNFVDELLEISVQSENLIRGEIAMAVKKKSTAKKKAAAKRKVAPKKKAVSKRKAVTKKKTAAKKKTVKKKPAAKRKVAPKKKAASKRKAVTKKKTAAKKKTVKKKPAAKRKAAPKKKAASKRKTVTKKKTAAKKKTVKKKPAAKRKVAPKKKAVSKRKAATKKKTAAKKKTVKKKPAAKRKTATKKKTAAKKKTVKKKPAAKRKAMPKKKAASKRKAVTKKKTAARKKR